MLNFKERWCKFCTSELYALLVGMLTLFGYLTKTEFYICLLNLALLILSLLLCDSPRPLAILHLLFIFQVPPEHSPSDPFFSDYYSHPVRWTVLIVAALLVAAAILCYLIRTHFFRDLFRGRMPMLLPLAILTAALLANGLFIGPMHAKNIGFACVQAVAFALDLLILCHGFRKESSEETLQYAITAALLTAYVIMAELLWRYLTHIGDILADDFYKGTLMLGWGTPNVAAILLVMMIPVLFCGVCLEKRGKLCYVTAFLALCMTVMSLSRGATLIGCVVFLIALIVTTKKRWRIDPFIRRATYLFLAALLVLAVCFGRTVAEKVFSIHFSLGLSDNGRFSIWKEALSFFFEQPLFGIGFYNLKLRDYQVFAAFYPDFSHNTIIQLLSTCGLFGLAAYVYYRIETVKLFLRRPSLAKSFFGLSLLALLIGSQIDIFVFMIYPMFYFNFFLMTSMQLDRQPIEPKTPQKP